MQKEKKAAKQSAEDILLRYKKDLNSVRLMKGMTLAVFVYLLWQFKDHINVPIGVAAVAVFFVALQYLRGMESQYFLNLEKLLNEECDAEKYTKVMEVLILKPGKDIQLLRLSLAKGLYYAGRLQDAEEQLDMFYASKPSYGISLMYHKIVFDCRVAGGDLESARKEREAMANLMAGRKPAQRAAAERQLLAMDAVLALEEERLEEFFPLQRQLLDEAKTPLQEIVAMYQLGRGELARGDAETAREHLELVAEDGGTLFMAAESRKLLQAGQLSE